MVKKLFGFVLAGALALSLAACGTAGENPGASPSPSQDVPSDSVSPAPAESESSSAEPSTEPSSEPSAEPSEEPPLSPELEDYDLPDRDYQPWQTAYMDFLALLQTHKTTQEPAEGGAEVGSETYSLYDVDKDGVPELFVKFGTCEADYFARCYTLYTDGLGQDVVVMAAQFPFGHSSLYTCPDRSAFLVYYAHMGYSQMQEYTMESGVLTAGPELLSEEETLEYIEPNEVVPGAEYIEYFYTRGGVQDDSFFTGETPYALGKALLLPVADWYDGPAPTGSNSEQARMAILAALNGERELYGVSGDHFFGDTGWTTWETYIQPGAASPFGDEPLQIKGHVWQDLNGDGQEECVLQMAYSQSNRGIVVLSEQEGIVYAYYFGFYTDMAVCEDSTFLGTYGWSTRVSFWKDQCYDRTVQPAAGTQPVEWVEGAPAA